MASSRCDDRQSGQATQQRWKFGAEKNCDQQVRHSHRKSGKQCKFPGFQALGKGTISAEQPGDHADDNEWHQRAGEHVEKCDLGADEVQHRHEIAAADKIDHCGIVSPARY